MSCHFTVPVGYVCPSCQQEHNMPKRSTGKTLVTVGVIGVLLLCGYLYWRYHSPYSMNYRSGDYGWQ